MNNFAAGLTCLLLLVPCATRAQDDASGGSTPEPAAEANAPAAPDERVEELRRLDARVRQLEARQDEVQVAPKPVRLGRRTVGLGLAAGGGVLASSLTETWPQSIWPVAWAEGRLPSVEARLFLSNGMSVDLSLPVGDILARVALNRGFLFEADVFWNFNLPVSPGVHLLLGPGLGLSIGGVATITNSGSPGPTIFGGEARVEMLAGAEFLTAGGHLGITLTARPHVDLSFFEGRAVAGAGASAVVGGGVLGLVGLNYYFLAR